MTYDARYYPHKLSGIEALQWISFYIAVFSFGPVVVYWSGKVVVRWVKNGSLNKPCHSSGQTLLDSGAEAHNSSVLQFVLGLASFVLIGLGVGFLVWIGITQSRQDELLMPFSSEKISLMLALGFGVGTLLPGVIAFAFLLRLLRHS